MFQRGDIVSVNFPFTDLLSGKQRPALIISNNKVNNAGDVIIVMISSRDKDDITNITITGDDVTIPLPKNSFVRCHRLATVDETIIQKKISEARPYFMEIIINRIISLIEANSK